MTKGQLRILIEAFLKKLNELTGYAWKEAAKYFLILLLSKGNRNSKLWKSEKMQKIVLTYFFSKSIHLWQNLSFTQILGDTQVSCYGCQCDR